MVPEKVDHFLNLSLTNLGFDWVDLYLIHVPFGVNSSSEADPLPMKDGQVVLDLDTNLEGIWSAMEDTVRHGKAGSIGVSNFDSGQINRVMKMAKIPVSVLQVELHAYFQQQELRSTCEQWDISIMAYSPLSSPGRGDFYKQIGL
jgi:aldehyde reductase